MSGRRSFCSKKFPYERKTSTAFKLHDFNEKCWSIRGKLALYDIPLAGKIFKNNLQKIQVDLWDMTIDESTIQKTYIFECRLMGCDSVGQAEAQVQISKKNWLKEEFIFNILN